MAHLAFWQCSPTWTVDHPSCNSLSIDLNSEWWACIDAGDAVDTNAREGSTCLEVHMKLRSKLRVTTVLSSPLSKNKNKAFGCCCRVHGAISLWSSRKLRTTLPLAHQQSFSLTILTCSRRAAPTTSLWSLNGIQMSDEEKFVSQSRKPCDAHSGVDRCQGFCGVLLLFIMACGVRRGLVRQQQTYQSISLRTASTTTHW